MRRLAEILEAVDLQQPAAELELRLALKSLSLYAIAANHKIQSASAIVTVDLMRKALNAPTDQRMYLACMRTDPERFLTHAYTPGTPEFKAGYERAKALAQGQQVAKEGGN